MAELDLVRHYTELSNKNFGVDSGFYPLGSCTMKYNPKSTKKLLVFLDLQNLIHYKREEQIQGSLEIIYSLQEELKEITGMDEVTLQPAAGAHGEWTTLMIFKAYHIKMVRAIVMKLLFQTLHMVQTLHQLHLPDLNQ